MICYHNSKIPLSRPQEMILFVLFRYHVGASYLSTDVFSVGCLASAECYLSYEFLSMKDIETDIRNFLLF